MLSAQAQSRSQRLNCPEGNMLNKSFAEEWNRKALGALELLNSTSMTVDEKKSRFTIIKACLEASQEDMPCYDKIHDILNEYTNQVYPNSAKLDEEGGFRRPDSPKYQENNDDIISLEKSIPKEVRDIIFADEFMDQISDANTIEDGIENTEKKLKEHYRDTGKKAVIARFDSTHFISGRDPHLIPNIGRLLIALPPNEQGCTKYLTIHIPSEEHKKDIETSYYKGSKKFPVKKIGSNSWQVWDKNKSERVIAVLDFCEGSNGKMNIVGSKFEATKGEEKYSFPQQQKMQDCQACHRGFLPINMGQKGTPGYLDKYGSKNARKIKKINKEYNGPKGKASWSSKVSADLQQYVETFNLSKKGSTR
jgi:hypothetical protein